MKAFIQSVVSAFMAFITHAYEKFEDTKEISKYLVNQRRTNNTMAKRKKTNNDLPNTRQKTKV